MKLYAVEITRSTERELQRLRRGDLKLYKRVLGAIDGLQYDPWPLGSIKLQGRDAYRVRVGNMRIIYSVEDGRALVVVIRVGARGDVYKG